jgi:predicted GNAT family N-acyltransferase
MNPIQATLVTTVEEREAVFALRMRVFVEEQNVPPEEELDAYDVTATHFLARLSPPPPGDPTGIIGTARLVDKGNGVGKVGRVAVSAEQRGKGVGNALMRLAEQVALEQGLSRLVLDAQIDAVPFYERLGYIAEGDIFLDAGIQHRFMSKSLAPHSEASS